jgi:hypothetical protein
MEIIEQSSDAVDKTPPQLTFGMVTRLIQLSKLQIKAIFSTILRQPHPANDTALSDTVTFFLLAADLFERLPFLKPEQRTLLMTELWRTLETANLKRLQQVVFLDAHFCTWTGQTGFLDLRQGDWLPELEHPACETIGYNLNELYRRGRAHIEKRSGLHGQHRAGSVEESGNLRVGFADNVSGPIRHGGPDVGPDDHRAGD